MSTANEAMQHAQAAHEKIESHEDLCAERYAHIHTSIAGVTKTVDTVLKILAWGGSSVFGLLILVLGFLGARAINGNDSEVSHLRDQIHDMQRPQAAVMPRPAKKQSAVLTTD